MEFKPECPGMGFLWSEEALRPFFRTVSDKTAHKRYAKPSKTEIKAINLELPLTHGLTFGAEWGYLGGMPETELDPWVFDPVDDKSDTEALAQVPKPTAEKSAQADRSRHTLARKARLAAEAEQNIRYRDLEEVPEEKFDMLSFASIAKLAAGLLYYDLHLLLHERGSPKTKAMILDWLFAEKWGYRWYANGYDTLPMNLIPFTAQFCCEVEGIDIDELRAAVSGLVELAVKRDAVEDAVAQPTSNDTQQMPAADSAVAEQRVQ